MTWALSESSGTAHVEFATAREVVSLSLSHTHTLSLSLFLSLAHSLSHTHSLTHTHTHTLSQANTALRAFGAAASGGGIKCVAVDGTKPDPPGSREAWGVLLGPDGFFVERRGEGDGARYVLKMTHVPTTMVEEEIQRLFERCSLSLFLSLSL